METLLTESLVVVSGLVGSDERLNLHHVIDLQYEGEKKSVGRLIDAPH